MVWLSKHVIPECYVDSCLVNVLLEFGKDGVNHTKGNSTVVKKAESKFENLFCICIIDKDRRDIRFITNECVHIELGMTDEYFKFFKQKDKPHYFIQIVPAIEQWIINLCDDLGIKLEVSAIKCKSLNEIKQISKTLDSKTDSRFISLFKEIIRKAEETDFKPVLNLREILKHILDKQYNVSDNDFEKWQTK